jgi:CheY-like chemotaxis protein
VKRRGHRTILCVDDEANQLVLRKALLEGAGYHVLTAESHRAALSVFRLNAVELVVADYWMSGGSGLQLASELKLLNGDLPVVILSAYSELPGESVGLADAWITKGTASQVLLDKISELLSRSLPVGIKPGSEGVGSRS